MADTEGAIACVACTLLSSESGFPIDPAPLVR